MNPTYEAEAHEEYARSLRDQARGSWQAGEWFPATPAWEAMMDVATSHGCPLAYRKDLLLIDRQIMAEDSSPCVWVLRDYGTHIVRTKTWLNAVQKPSATALWFYWDGKSLTPVTYEAAQELAAGWPQ